MVSDGWRGIGVAFAVPPRVGERSRHKHTRGGGDAHQRVSAKPGAAGRVRAPCREPSRDCAVRRVGHARQRSAGTGWTAPREFPDDGARAMSTSRQDSRAIARARDAAPRRARCVTRPGPRSPRCRRDCPTGLEHAASAAWRSPYRSSMVLIWSGVTNAPACTTAHRPCAPRRAGSGSARERMKFIVHGEQSADQFTTSHRTDDVGQRIRPPHRDAARNQHDFRRFRGCFPLLGDPNFCLR